MSYSNIFDERRCKGYRLRHDRKQILKSDQKLGLDIHYPWNIKGEKIQEVRVTY
jgi:hypothetical protein